MSRVTMKQGITQEARDYSSGGYNNVAFKKEENNGIVMLKRFHTLEEFSNYTRAQREYEFELGKVEQRAIKALTEMYTN